MKQKFSTKWKSSRQPRKQRKYSAEAPLHLKRKELSANLSEELRKKYRKRSIKLRKNDEVRVMRGKFTKKQGKITAFNKRKMKVAIEGLQTTKRDGTKINVWFHPSKLQILNLDLDDKKRLKITTKPEKKGEENAHNKK